MDTKNLWQQATITYSADSNFDKIKKGHGLFILNDMVRYHMCDLPKKEILDKSKFSAKLAGLPRFTTGKQLVEIGHMLNATAWIIPRARSNYLPLQHAYFYFPSADDAEAALSNDNLTIDNKHVTWTKSNAKLCAICSSPHHKASACPRKRKTPDNRSVQKLYQRFQPAQFSNYKAPTKPLKGAVNPNVTFAHVTGSSSNAKSPSEHQKNGQKNTQNRPPQTANTLETNDGYRQQAGSWSDDIPDTLNDRLFDQTIVPTPQMYMANGTMKGGSMHDNNQDDFKEFVRQQFLALNDNLSYLVKSLDFTVQRVAAIEQSMNIKVVTPFEAESINLKKDDAESMTCDEIEPSIDTSSSIIVQQRKTINGLKSVNQMHQNRLKSFTLTVNTLVKSCAAFQSILVQNNMLPKDLANNMFPLGDAFDSDVDQYLKDLPQF